MWFGTNRGKLTGAGMGFWWHLHAPACGGGSGSGSRGAPMHPCVQSACKPNVVLDEGAAIANANLVAEDHGMTVPIA